ncbi:MAG: hypothetical protein ACFFD4_18700 [Candidatus Odinarchaeota archaeon]
MEAKPRIKYLHPAIVGWEVLVGTLTAPVVRHWNFSDTDNTRESSVESP